MAYANHTQTHVAGGTPLATRIAAFGTALRADYAKWRVYRRTLDELASLTDRDLADLGIARGQIGAVARSAAYGGPTT